jgi:hypothetical protein
MEPRMDTLLLHGVANGACRVHVQRAAISSRVNNGRPGRKQYTDVDGGGGNPDGRYDVRLYGRNLWGQLLYPDSKPSLSLPIIPLPFPGQ